MKSFQFIRWLFVIFLSAAAQSSYAAITPVTAAQCEIMQVEAVLSVNGPIGCNRLVKVTFDYTGFDGKSHQDGAIIVLDFLGEHVEAIFAALHQRAFPLQMAKPMEAFKGNDEASMSANNTSGFNGRAMTGSHNWSKHAYGVAIDLNPMQNPYITTQKNPTGQSQKIILPPESYPKYLNRMPIQTGMVEHIVPIFYHHGFLIWGGNWHRPIDYQHFEIGTMPFIQALIAMPLATAKTRFNAYIDAYRQCALKAHQGKNPRLNDLTTCANQVRKSRLH
jgi:hypothetical protein